MCNDKSYINVRRLATCVLCRECVTYCPIGAIHVEIETAPDTAEAHADDTAEDAAEAHAEDAAEDTAEAHADDTAEDTAEAHAEDAAEDADRQA